MNELIEETEESRPERAEAAAPERQSEVKVVDKRRFARLLGFGAGAAEQAAEPERLPTYVEQLKQRAESAAEQARAEVEAARGRLERYYETQLASARVELVAGLLEVLDNLERALEAPGAAESPLYEGVAATRDIFLRRLAEMGVEPVPTLGEPFDPERMEAVDEVAVEDPEQDGRVVEQLQRGFRFGERLVRPAAVRVGRAS